MGRVHADLGDVLVLGLVDVAQTREIVEIGALAAGRQSEVVLVVEFVTDDHAQVVVVPRILIPRDGVVGLRQHPRVAGRSGVVAVRGAGIDQIGSVELLLLVHVEIPHAVQFQRNVIRQAEIQALVHREAVVRVAAVEAALGRIPVTVLPVGRRDDLLAVGIVVPHRRGRREHDTEEVGLAAADVVAHLAAVRTREVERTGRFEPRRDLVGAVGHERETLVVGDHRETRLVVVAQAGVVASPVVAARRRNVVVLRERQVAHRGVAGRELTVDDRLARDRVDHALVALLEQIGVLVGEEHRAVDTLGRLVAVCREDVTRTEGACGRERRDVSRTVGGQTQVVEVVVGLEELVGLAQVVQAHVGLERDLGTAHAAPLGRDEHHAGIGPGTVERRCCGILQDLDRLDVVGVDVVHVLTLHTVDHVEGRTGAVQRRTAADDDRGGGTRLSGRRGNPHAGHRTGQRRQGVRPHTLLEHVARHLRDRSRQLVLGHGPAVTGHDHLAHVDRVLAQRDVDLVLAADSHRLRRVAQRTELEHAPVVLDHQRIGAVQTGGRTVGGSLLDDRHADHRLARGIGDLARHRKASLRPGYGCRKQGQHYGQHRSDRMESEILFHGFRLFRVIRTSNRSRLPPWEESARRAASSRRGGCRPCG